MRGFFVCEKAIKTGGYGVRPYGMGGALLVEVGKTIPPSFYQMPPPFTQGRLERKNLRKRFFGFTQNDTGQSASPTRV